MRPRYCYAKVTNEEGEHELYAILDYSRDELVRWATNEEAAKQLRDALNKSEEEYEMW